MTTATATTTSGLSEKQRAMRAEGLGASEIPVALGLSPFQSAAELAAVKRGELPPFEGNRFTHWGTTLEGAIVQEWLRRHREAGEDVSIFTPPTMRHPKSPVVMATSDRIVVPEGRRARDVWQGCLEAKLASAYRASEFGEEADAIPEAYMVQVQVQLEVLDLPQAWLVTLIGGNDWREYHQERDREMGGQLVEFAEKWWSDHVVQGIAVEPDGTDAYSAFLKKRYPSNLSGLLEARPEHFDLVEAVRQAKAALKSAEETEAAAVAALKAAIGEAEGIAGLATWKNNKPGSKTDWQQVAKQLHASPELISKFTTPTAGARVLRLITSKE